MLPPSPIVELQRRIAVYDDELAYKQLFFILYKPLQKFSYSFVQSHEMSEEIVSDVFISIWQKRKQLEEIRNLRVYMYICAKNTSLQYLLRNQKKVTIHLDELSVHLENPDPAPDQVMITAEMAKLIISAVDQLPPRCKMIYRLVKEDCLKYKEVAEILNISVKTIDNQLAIALERIAQVIDFKIRKTVSL